MDNFKKSNYESFLRDVNNGYDVISKYARNLNLLAIQGKLNPTYNREAEIEKIKMILCRRTKPNPLLTGVAGVGKTAIIEGLAASYVNDYLTTDIEQVPIIYDLSLNSLLSGARYRGDFEERVSDIIRILERNNDIIVFIDEIHCLCEAGGAEGAITGGQAFKPPLARGTIKVIGATTTAEYEKTIAKDKALARRFSMVRVSSLTDSAKTNCIEQILNEYGKYFNINVSAVTVDNLQNIVDNMIPHTTFPDNVIDIIDETLATAKYKQLNAITDKDIKETASRQHNLIII